MAKTLSEVRQGGGSPRPGSRSFSRQYLWANSSRKKRDNPETLAAHREAMKAQVKANNVQIGEEVLPPEEIHVIAEGKDPPMMLILRRQAIRNFPGNKRVALFANPQLKIQIAVPYDASTGALEKSNLMPIKEWYEVGHKVEIDRHANRLGPSDPHPRRGQAGTITKVTDRPGNRNLGSVHVKFKDGKEEEIDKRHLISLGEEWSYGDPVNISVDGRDDEDQRPEGSKVKKSPTSGEPVDRRAAAEVRVSNQHYRLATSEEVLAEVNMRKSARKAARIGFKGLRKNKTKFKQFVRDDVNEMTRPHGTSHHVIDHNGRIIGTISQASPIEFAASHVHTGRVFVASNKEDAEDALHRYHMKHMREDINESYDWSDQPSAGKKQANDIKPHEWAHAAGFFDSKHSYAHEPYTFGEHRKHYMQGYNSHRKMVGLKPIKEDHDADEGMVRAEIESALYQTYQDLVNKPDHTQLEAAIFNWLTDEIQEYGDFDEMPEENLRDNFDDLMGLMNGALDGTADRDEVADRPSGISMQMQMPTQRQDVTEDETDVKADEVQPGEEEAEDEIEDEGPSTARATDMNFPRQTWPAVQQAERSVARRGNMNFPKQTDPDMPDEYTNVNSSKRFWWVDRPGGRDGLGEGHRPERKINDFATWHDQANRRGDATFKMHNAGNSTSAFRNGKHIGTFHHDKRLGILREETLVETPFMKIQGIMRRGEPAKVRFLNGDEATVHHKTGEVLNALFTRLTPGSAHLHKLSKMINSSHAGMKKVHAFAKQALGKA